MSLADNWDGGGNYLGAGWHKVHIEDFSLFTYPNTGSPGVKFVVKNLRGAESSVSFSLKQGDNGRLTPGCNTRLAWFAKTCGLTRQEGAAYEPERASSHSVLVRKSVQVLLELKPDKKYHEITEWREFDAKELPYTPPTETAVPPVAADVPAGPRDDDIPF